MMYKMRCPVCGAHFAKLDLRTQSDTVLNESTHKSVDVEVLIGLCPECNSVLGVGGPLEAARRRRPFAAEPQHN